MVNFEMEVGNRDSNNGDLDTLARKRTKKSLRLSEKKELVKKKIKEREKQRIEDEKKEKEETGSRGELISVAPNNISAEVDEDETFNKAKQKRHWEYWAKADKDTFFEAICEYGKDFDKIYSFMERKAKCRAKSVKDFEPRNKDQIRYFYYRTWKQISKAITLQPSESKRVNHEIYCMICYGELRKKDVGGFGIKDLKKLDELVTTGLTAVRYRGRKIRVKPPTCKFLKKLSDDDERSGREIESIPEIIDVELYPRSNNVWTTAQCIASNPRLRLPSLPITLKLRSLLKLLQKRYESVSADLLPNPSSIALHAPAAGSESVERRERQKETAKSKQLHANSCASEIVSNADQSNKAGFDSSQPSPAVNQTTAASCTVNEKQTQSANNGSAIADTTPPSSLLLSPRVIGRDSGRDSRAVVVAQTPFLSVESGTESQTENNKADDAVDESSACVAEDDSISNGESTIFPITSDSVADKDLQMCYVALRRPSKIRLEYDWEKKQPRTSSNDNENEIGNDDIKNKVSPSLKKLLLLSQRDLEKMIRCQVTSQAKSSSHPRTSAATASKALPPPKSPVVARPLHNVKTRYTANQTLDLSSTVAASQFQSVAAMNAAKLPTICFPALTNTARPTTVVHRKLPPRLKSIQPASKTLMAKAVAVNIVPQPAQLVQFAQVRAASTQLVNSGGAASSVAVGSSCTENSTVETSSVFSSPSAQSLSSPITIWSSPLMHPPAAAGQVQVEVIQEGSGGSNKAPAKRLHPIQTVDECAVKKLRLDNTSVVHAHAPLQTGFSDVDLDFLASTASNDASRLSCMNEPDGVNLSSILSGLTKNLRQNEETSTSKFTASPQSRSETTAVTTASSIASSSSTAPLSFAITSNTVTALASSSKNDQQPPKSPEKTTSTRAATSSPSVLLTPVKNVNRTPSKNDSTFGGNTREHVENFGSQWFGEDITDISLGGLLDVASLKDHAKNSDSSQASDVSIGNLLNVERKRCGVDDTNTEAREIYEMRCLILSILNSNDGSDISIGTLLGVGRKEKKEEKSTPASPLKPYNNDSLLMKPGGDPVVAFESLMDENSIDYINKFKDLTAKFKANNSEQQQGNKNQNSTSVHPHDDNHRSQQLSHHHTDTHSSSSDVLSVKTSGASAIKDPTMPVYRSEDSVGLLDDLSFVLPVDNNSTDSLKSYS
eukprot:gene7503-8334_t